jgi:hypothetical protein
MALSLLGEGVGMMIRLPILASMLVVVLKRAITHAAQFAIGIELSMQRAASCGRHVLDDILRCLLGNVPELARAVDRACVFLGEKGDSPPVSSRSLPGEGGPAAGFDK